MKKFIKALPNKEINASNEIGKHFINEGINNFHEACDWVNNLTYGYNENKYDPLVLFKEKKGTCSTKHGTIAALAEENNLSVYKYYGFYKLENSIIKGVDEILNKYKLNFIPQTHCFIGSNMIFIDLTRGNCHEKSKELIEFDIIIRVKPFPDPYEESYLYKFGLEYYKLNYAAIAQFSNKKIFNIRDECDTLHKNLCSFK